MLEYPFKRLCALAFLLVFAIFGAGGAFAQAPKAAPDPEFIAAKAAFETLGLDARKAIQRDLIWAGGLEASATGEFGALTYAAIRRFETSANFNLDGILAENERAVLASAAEKARGNAGFRIETDTTSKMRIGIPGKFLVKRSENGSGGGRWQDKGEKATLDLQVLKPDEQLPALFGKGTSSSVAGRKITYKLLRPDFFVISGETAGGKFYRRVEKGADGALRGFSLGYDKALAPDFDKLIIAIAASFEPFPGRATAALPTNTSAKAPPTARRKTITGVFVGPDSLISSATAVCKGATLASGSRSPVTFVKADGESGLGLFRASGNGTIKLHAGEVGEQALLLQREADGELVASSASLTPQSVQAPLQDGGAGSPILDRTGALVGVIVTEPVQKFAVAGTVPLMRYRYADAKAVERLTGITPAAAGAERSAGQIAAELESSVVSIVCNP